MAPARFERAQRLVDSKDYQRLAKVGRRFSSSRFVLLATEQSPPGETRLGITVARRVGNAVQRNRVKRRVREWFRTAAPRLPRGVDLVVIARAGAGTLGHRQAVEELDQLVREAVR